MAAHGKKIGRKIQKKIKTKEYEPNKARTGNKLSHPRNEKMVTNMMDLVVEKRRQKKSQKKRGIQQYTHEDKKRLNNPPVGLVTPDTDREKPKKKYQYDPHLDPQLVWAGKAEHISFQVPTVSLHVHERIDPRTIIDSVRKRNGNGGPQMSLFEAPTENPPIRDAIEFYKHKHNWTNRLIAGDSLLVMNSLLEKEGMAGQVQMIYIDPPYGIKYGSNFQPFVNKRNVKDKDEDLTHEPEMLRAFRDTWELGIHSYLAYLRDRLLLARELLAETGSCFVQISDENIHLIRNLMDEVLGKNNFVSLISFRTKIPLGTKYLAGIADYLVWYAKDISKMKFHKIFSSRAIGEGTQFTYVELPDGSRRKMSTEEKEDLSRLPKGSRPFRLTDLVSSGRTESCVFEFGFDGKKFFPSRGKSWKTNQNGIAVLIRNKRIMAGEKMPAYVFYQDDFPVQELTNQWVDTQGASNKVYAVQTSTLAIQRCLLMATDSGDLVFDPTCGGGTTAFVAEQYGRRWITCDTSRVAITLAKQRLMTAVFDYYELAHPEQGIASGFKYKTVPHVTLGSIANNEPPAQETLYDQPLVDKSKVRVTGPFTVEAVPAPVVRPIDENGNFKVEVADSAIARSGGSLRQSEWRDELLKTGVRGRGGHRIEFSRLEPLPGMRWLHVDGETKAFRAGQSAAGEALGQAVRVVVSFGPEHAPLEQRQVALAIEEAQTLVPKPKIVIFAAFQFDPEAAKDIDELNWPGVTLLKVQMNADLLTEDLKKKRASNESFWLIGQPDIELKQIKKGEHKGKWQVEVHGFDYYNPRTGTIESGGKDKIAMWLLDPDYDGRSLFPQQVFFPMADAKEGWAKLMKNLKAEIDEDLIEAYRGTVSLPFAAGKNQRIAVKIIDDRGIESLKLADLKA